MNEVTVKGNPCPSCGEEMTPTTHRADGSARKNPGEKRDGVSRGEQRLCFNGLLKSEHICVAECSKPGLFCRNCRLLVDTSERKA